MTQRWQLDSRLPKTPKFFFIPWISLWPLTPKFQILRPRNKDYHTSLRMQKRFVFQFHGQHPRLSLYYPCCLMWYWSLFGWDRKKLEDCVAERYIASPHISQLNECSPLRNISTSESWSGELPNKIPQFLRSKSISIWHASFTGGGCCLGSSLFSFVSKWNILVAHPHDYFKRPALD